MGLSFEEGLEVYDGACLDMSQYGTAGKLMAVVGPTLLFFAPLLVFSIMYCSRLSSDTETVKPKAPDISSPQRILCLASPRCCCSCTIPCLYSKPEEYIRTWFWTDFIYTWPWQPRDGETKLTQTDRVVVMVLVVFTDIILFLVCSYGISKFSDAAGVENKALSGLDGDIVSLSAGNSSGIDANVTVGLNTTAPATPLPTDAATKEATEQIGFAVACLVTSFVVLLESVVQWLIMLLLGIVQTMKKATPMIGFLTLGMCLFYFGVCGIFIVVVMCEMSCSAFLYNVLVPYVGTFPVGTVLALVGPYGYLFHNSFGSGLTVEEKIAEMAGSDMSITFENPSTDDADDS